MANSLANKTIIDELSNNKGITIRHLDKLYSGYSIDVVAEQNALVAADTIVLQFPFYWYSTPASLKNWIDQVFTFNFAYGPEGDKLKGKNLIVSITVGGPQDAYTPLGYNHFSIAEFLKPLEQTATLTQMRWNPPVFTHGCVYIPGGDNIKEEVEARVHEHTQRLLQQLEILSK